MDRRTIEMFESAPCTAIGIGLVLGCLASGACAGSSGVAHDTVDGFDVVDVAIELPEPVARECGITDDGGYIGPCDRAFGNGQRSTLCDEVHGTCFVPEKACSNGWCRIPAASYVTGVAEHDMNQAVSQDDASIRNVPRNFLIMDTEVTNAAFTKLMRYPPPNAPPCLDCPVGAASIFAAMEYANRLSLAEGRTPCYEMRNCDFEPIGPYEGWSCEEAVFAGPECLGYRLPSRAEWELASRAGSPWAYAYGEPCCGGCSGLDPMSEYSHACGSNVVDYRPCVIERFFKYDSGDYVCAGPSPVGQILPNPFGLFDNNGNVSELTQTIVDPALLCGTVACFPPAPKYAAPLQVDHRDEFFDYVVSRHSLMYSAGGRYTQDPGYTSSNFYEGAALTIDAIELQELGFRLVRTLPEGE